MAVYQWGTCYLSDPAWRVEEELLALRDDLNGGVDGYVNFLKQLGVSLQAEVGKLRKPRFLKDQTNEPDLELGLLAAGSDDPDSEEEIADGCFVVGDIVIRMED